MPPDAAILVGDELGNRSVHQAHSPNAAGLQRLSALGSIARRNRFDPSPETRIKRAPRAVFMGEAVGAVVLVAVKYASACPLWSRTTKQAGCSSTVQGSGRRRYGIHKKNAKPGCARLGFSQSLTHLGF